MSFKSSDIVADNSSKSDDPTPKKSCSLKYKCWKTWRTFVNKVFLKLIYWWSFIFNMKIWDAKWIRATAGKFQIKDVLDKQRFDFFRIPVLKAL